MEIQNNLNSRKPPKNYGKKIVWHPTSPIKILQIYNRGLEFALVSDKFEQCHPFVWCKDFLHDTVFATIHEKNFEIYRFKYDPIINPKVCLREVRLLVANAKDFKIEKRINNCIDFLNQVEDQLKISRSKVRKCLDAPVGYKNGVYLFQGNKKWLQAPPLISLYSLLIRLGFAHQIGTHYSTTLSLIGLGHLKPYQNKDQKWLNEIQPALNKIIRLGFGKIFYKKMKLNYPSNFHIDRVHNSLGIMAFANDMRLKAAGLNVNVPHWHRFQ